MMDEGHRVEDYLHKLAADAGDLQQLLRSHSQGFFHNKTLLKHLNVTVLVMTEAMENILKHMLSEQDTDPAGSTAGLLEQARAADLLPEDVISRMEQLFLLRHNLNSRYPHLNPTHLIRRAYLGIEGFLRFVDAVSPMI